MLNSKWLLPRLRSPGTKSGAVECEPPTHLYDSETDFDPIFYTRHYPDLEHLSPQQARDHWTRFGQAEGRYPSAAVALVKSANWPDLPPDFDLADYLLLNPDLDDATIEDWEYVYHFLNFGLPEHRRYESGILDRDFISQIYGKDIGRQATRTAMKRTFDSSREPFLVRFYSSQQHLLASHWIRNPDTLSLLDSEYYYYTNDLGRDPYRESMKFSCLRHFCEVGLRQLQPIADRLTFDPVFYRNTYGPSPRSGKVTQYLGDDVVLYLDWLNSRPDQNRCPNGRMWLLSQAGVDVPLLDVLELEAYRNANADLAALRNDHEVAAHLLEHGVFEGRIAIPATLASASIFTALADELAAKASSSAEPILGGEGGTADSSTEWSEKAKIVYDRVVQFTPDYAPGVGRAAEYQLRKGNHREALDLFARIVALGQESASTYTEMATCCGALKDARRNLQVLTAGTLRFPGDFGLGEARRAAAEQYFWEEWKIADAMAMAGHYTAAQSRVTEASRLALPHDGGSTAAKPIRSVAIVANLDLEQCRFYRVEQKIEQLQRAGFKVSLFDWSRDIAAFMSELALYEAVIFYRVTSFPSVTRAILAARAVGLLTFYEIDDLLFDAAFYPDRFDDYAGQISREEYSQLTLGVPLFAHAMSLCDYGIASTPSLAARMSPIVRTGRVFLHRNGFGSKHEMWAAKRSNLREGPVTLFYGSATKAHKKDFQDILEPALEKISNVHGDKVRIVLMGYAATSGTRPKLDDTLIRLPLTWNLDEYWSAIQAADINLSVLKPSPLTEAKSEIKWLEAAMLGVPSVVSNVGTLAEVIDNGVDGCLCNTPDDFFVAIDRLVRSRDLRTKMGDAARRKVRAAYGLAAMADNLGVIMRAVSPPPQPKPKILLVNVFYPPQAIGGATRVVHDNVRQMTELAGDEFAFEVFTSVEGSHRAYEMSSHACDGVRVVGVTTPIEPQHDLKAADARMGDIFEKHLVAARPAMIHFHCIQRLTASVVAAAQRHAIPYVITAHDAWWISENQFLQDRWGQTSTYAYDDPLKVLIDQGRAAFNRMEALRPALQGAEAILAVSERFAEIYRACGVEKVRAITNGVSKEFSPVVRKTNTSRVVVAHIGGLELHKGYQFFKYALSAELSGTCRRSWSTTRSRRAILAGTSGDPLPSNASGRFPKRRSLSSTAGSTFLLRLRCGRRALGWSPARRSWPGAGLSRPTEAASATRSSKT